MSDPAAAIPTPRARRWVALECTLWALGLAVVGAAFALRLEAHVGYLHDHESLLIPTAGRELLHGHAGQFRWFQANVYQGSSVVDAFLSAAGFAVFGDGLLAWKWYGVAYAVGIAGAGAYVLSRLTGRAGGAAFVLLMAAAPFLLKDGLLTPAGGHASGFFYALLSLAVAVGGRGAPTFARGLVAGAILGIATWYMRTAVSAGPALLVALAPGGVRALAGLAVGVFSFPALCAGNAWVLTTADGPLVQRGFTLVLRETLGAVRAEHVAPDHAGKLLEALGGPVRRFLFAQPQGPGTPHDAVLFAWAARVWGTGWLVVLGGLAAASALVARASLRRHGWAAAVLLALALGYAGSYVLSPFRIDADLIRAVVDVTRVPAPGVPAPRYLVPVYLAYTLGAAGLAGLASGTWITRVVAVVGVGWLAWAGGLSARMDAERYGEPDHVWQELRPYSYETFFGSGQGRGPAMYWHARCAHPDPVSRANHRRAVGSFWAGDPSRVVTEPDYVARRLREYTEAWGQPLPEDLPFIVQGIGRRLGDAPHGSADIPLHALIDGLLANAKTLGPELGETLLQGVAEGLPWDAFTQPMPTRARLLCRPTGWGTAPLCGVVGRMAVDPEVPEITTPEALFGRSTHPALVRVPLVEGAAAELRRRAPSVPWSDEVLAAWPKPLADAFRRGWAFEDAKIRWRPGHARDPRLIP